MFKAVNIYDYKFWQILHIRRNIENLLSLSTKYLNCLEHTSRINTAIFKLNATELTATCLIITTLFRKNMT